MKTLGYFMREYMTDGEERASPILSPRETDWEKNDADRMVVPVAGLAWIVMGIAAYVWPEHFRAWASFANEIGAGFTIIGLLLLVGNVAPRIIARQVLRLAPWFLFFVLFVEIWLVGPAKTPL
ncbi:hypothetical protein DW352_14140 [Pseudolabrys taiwanensis]|uniref:Uncharacterized protein n=1 Tax=Pseudolabrys taiwanensis TaxID=331696 RepID=A0A345ZXA8_9HYPH|nr:hypothetical protein [Pseudolabrys taiwanensis]AXK81555.1 hypothetical protein DW352_14140 [Pseudolabrys taiwanensis]